MSRKILGVEETSDKNLLEICEKVLFDLIDKLKGYKPHKVEVVYGYRFSISANIRNRKLVKISGGDGKGKTFSEAEIWSIYPNEVGNFAKIVDNSSGHERCDACGGSGKCVCNGSGKERCGECGGSGKDTCSRCGGRGLEQCPNCRGRGYIYEKRLRNCSRCHGRGQILGDSCSRCHGRGQETYEDSVHCPTCGGDGTITCKKCIGKGGQQGIKCRHCNGSGKVKCQTCGGSGECPKCKGTGRVNYQLKCEQKEFSHLESCTVIVYDSCMLESSSVREGFPKFNMANASVIFTWTTSNEDENCASVDKIGKIAFVNAQGKKWESDSLFEALWKSLQRNLSGDGEKNPGRGGKYRFFSKSFEIAKAPLMLKFTFEMLGKEGFVYVDLAKKECVAYGLQKIRNEQEKRSRSRDRFWTILSYCSYYGLIALALAIPYFFGERTILEYFAALVRPEWLAGVATYYLCGYVYFYLYTYVWRLAEPRNYGKHSSNLSCKWGRRLLRLLWIFVPLVAWKVLDDIIPVLSSNVVLDEIGKISENAWSYIVAICFIKHCCIVVPASKWKWDVRVRRLLTGLLACFALILALWPVLLPEGTWLQTTLVDVGWLELFLILLLLFGKIFFIPLGLAMIFFSWIAEKVAYLVAFKWL